MFRYGFFNAVDGDRLYNADDISSFFTGLMSDGVCTVPPTSLWVLHREGLTFAVLPGRAFVQSKYFINTSSFDVTLEAADPVLPRIDRIVLQLDYRERRFNIVAKKGTAAASPVPPTLTHNPATKWELSLARISVPAGATDLPTGGLIDERPDASACGFATITAGDIAVYAFQVGVQTTTAVITHSEVTGNPNKMLVEIRCDAIADVTPPSSAWAIGSLAWDVGAGKMYGLTSSGWTAQT